MKTKYGLATAWIRSHASHEGDDCLAWPFTRNAGGYGTIWANGGHSTASRLMCIEANGVPPFPGAEAAHSCGRGRFGCVNPRHLSWKTRQQNNAEKASHDSAKGEKNPQAKLTAAIVLDIRAAFDSRSMRPPEISEHFGVGLANVYSIVRRHTWGWLECA